MAPAKHRIFRTRHAVFLLCMALLPGCEILDVQKTLIISTGEIVAKGNEKAIVSGTLFDAGEEGILQYGHCWSTNNNPALNKRTSTTLGSRTSGCEFQSLLSGLVPATHYYVRAYALTSSDTLYGEVIDFTTWVVNTAYVMPETSDAVAVYSEESFIVDGMDDEPAWQEAYEYKCSGVDTSYRVSYLTPNDLTCTFKLMYSDAGLMVWAHVQDDRILTHEEYSSIDNRSWYLDYVEIYLHNGPYPTPTGEYTEKNSFQIRFNPFYTSATMPNPNDIESGRYGLDWEDCNIMYSHVDFVTIAVNGGYNTEAYVSWDLFEDKPGDVLYFDMIVLDSDDPENLRESLISWNNTTPVGYNDQWFNINYMGRLLLYKPLP